jgi:long-chain acyl-CoA synthetase
MKESPFIEQIMVIGENERYCSALVCPNIDHLKSWAGRHEIQHKSVQELINKEEVNKKYSEEIEALNFDVEYTMHIKKFIIVPDSWGPDTGELSPTLKLKREFIMKKYQAQIDYLYGYSE